MKCQNKESCISYMLLTLVASPIRASLDWSKMVYPGLFSSLPLHCEAVIAECLIDAHKTS